MRCRHCGEEVEEGRNFCPHCGQSLTDEGAHEREQEHGGDSPALEQVALQRRESRDETAGQASMRAVPMSSFETSRNDADKSRRNIYIAVALGSALILGVLVALAMRPAPPDVEPHLEGALRAGSPEFDQYQGRIERDFVPDDDAIVSQRALGDMIITMNPTVRNFTGRTITGLEFRAVSLDSDGVILKARTVIPVPGRQAELEPNRTLTFPIVLEGFKPDNVPADLKLELTGVKFK